MKKIGLALVLALLPALPAYAVDCLHAPYGADQDMYGAMVAGAAAAAQDTEVTPQTMVAMVKAELRMACAAKYHHVGLAHYEALGITRSEVAHDSVTELAQADMDAENARVKREAAAPAWQAVTVRQFAIEGPRLARAGAEVRITGVYVRDGNMEYLYANSNDAALAQSPGYETAVPRVALLTQDASDQAREAFLNCTEQPTSVYYGCPVELSGLATECEESTIYGGARELACLDVKELVQE